MKLILIQYQFTSVLNGKESLPALEVGWVGTVVDDTSGTEDVVVLGIAVDCAVDCVVVETIIGVLRGVDVAAVVVTKTQNKRLINMILGRVRTVFDLSFGSKQINGITTSIDS